MGFLAPAAITAACLAWTGAPLVLLHGGGPGASAWSNWKQNLPALAGHFRVLAVDQPGYGRSDKPLVRGGMWEFYARAVRGLLNAPPVKGVEPLLLRVRGRCCSGLNFNPSPR